jgi:hypothetical protein
MRHTWCIVSVFAAVPLLADTHLDVGQLAGTIASALAVDRNDKRIAQSLKPVRLTERLTAETAELLVKMGAARYSETYRRISSIISFCSDSVGTGVTEIAS